MEVWSSSADVPPDFGPTVVVIGSFDGVHCGHRLLIERAAERAARCAARVVVCTFEPHPRAIVRPDDNPPRLTNWTQRLDRLDGIGVHGVLLLPFDRARSQQSAEDFIGELANALNPACFVIGSDFRYGYGASGNSALLRSLGRAGSFGVDIVTRLAGPAWSSSQIRELLVAGELEAANHALGYQFVLDGELKDRGRRDPAPCAPGLSVQVDEDMIVPRGGVYAGRLMTKGGAGTPAVITTPGRRGDPYRIHPLQPVRNPAHEVSVAFDTIVRWPCGEPDVSCADLERARLLLTGAAEATSDNARSRLVVVMGVSGCGKSTVAQALAARLGWDVVEGDDLHPLENVRTMARGRPLTDADRAAWLLRVGARIARLRAADRPLVVTCSALKRASRDRLRVHHPLFVHLNVPQRVLESRLADRIGHFMPPSLLHTQLADLEPPAAEPDVHVLDADRPTLAIVEDVVVALRVGRHLG